MNNLKKVSDSFFNSFYSNHVILYIGQNAKDEELREYISQCPWSCVITSRRDPELATFFSNGERTAQEFTDRSKIPAKPLNRKKLPILRLFGVSGEVSEEKEDLSWLRADSVGDAYDFYHAIDMLQLLPDLLDHVNPLIIIGANSDVDWKLFGKELTPLLYTSATDGTVTLWDMPDSVESRNANAFSILRTVVEKKRFSCYGESLAEVIRPRIQEFTEPTADSPMLPDSEDDIYYQGRRTVSISQRDLLVFKNVGTLLTERTLNRIRPLGRVMSRKWFANFHEASSDLGPQWYGYLRQSDFHLKRSFEDALVQVVRKMLDGKNVMGSSIENRPVILSGPPGSSKSVTLAALAHRIYNETVNPVIFIPKHSFLSDNLGGGFDELDEAMHLLETKAETDTRILVIWDSSAYKSGIARAHKLLEQLWNRGRRFVLVCSSYEVNFRGDDSSEGYVYNDNTETFSPCDISEAQVVDSNDCYYVRAIRQMTKKEIEWFWTLTREYSGINEVTISRFRRKLAEENRTEIFEYYFLLITLLRDNLASGLRSEQSKITPYVTKELQRAISGIRQKSREEKKVSPMYQAFLAAGMNPEDFFGAEESAALTEQDDSLDKKLDDLNLCVALFSRFKLSVPYTLAYTLLVGDDTAEQYSESTRDLYQLVTSDIPWLHYGEDTNGNFSFRFRNSLEADIFLTTHEYNGDQQIDLMCHIIDIYGRDYRRSRCIDQLFTESLQSLLRLIGPNSEHFATSIQAGEHMCLLKRLDDLIDKLEGLRDEYGVPDEDAGFATIIVTFIREYYGKIWNDLYSSALPADMTRWQWDEAHFAPEDYEYRIERLLSAISLAERSVEDLENRAYARVLSHSERQHLRNQRYILANEIAQCNMRLEDLADEYLRCCKDFGIPPKTELTNRKLRYQVLYRQLLPLISSNPTNGYAYNTLFKAFCRTYEKEKLSDTKKLQYLSEIMQVVDTCDTLGSEITNRGGQGSDELTKHINRIKDFSAGQRINLDTIICHRKGIAPADDAERVCFELYDEMLEANNAAAITFICQKELQLPKGTRKLNPEFLARCRKVYSFMREDDNLDCICANAYALAMLIRVTWMVHNETLLTSTPECQLTRLKIRQWAEIYRLCRQYDELAGENKQPLIILLYALSALQVSRLSEIGYQEAVDIISSMNEDMFYQRRMWTPFMICQEDGTPYKFTGTVLSIKDNNGFIRVNGVPQRLKMDNGIRFRQYNLGRSRKMPEVRDVLSDLELGIGFTCLSVYNEAGRKDREAKA